MTEVPALELTVEEVLQLHRQWIFKLLLNDKKTEAEIVALLHEHHIPISLPQIHSFILRWDLLPLSTAPPPTTTTPTPTFPPMTSSVSSHEPLPYLHSPSPSTSTTSTTIPTAPSPQLCDLYKQRPLPSLPSKAPSPDSQPHDAQDPCLALDTDSDSDDEQARMMLEAGMARLRVRRSGYARDREVASRQFRAGPRVRRRGVRGER